jgi:HSP20 family molecular chaperone IbpA
MQTNLLNQQIDVPMDMYQSATEILIVLPLGGVHKESVQISLTGHHLVITGIRSCPIAREKYVPLLDHCFRGKFEKKVELPESVYFDKIYSELSPENILTVIVPKVIIPERVEVVIR